MHDPLAPLLADGVIDAVLSRLKSGKEADLFMVEHRGEVLAAKVYKARQDRNFKNNAAYMEGRKVRNTRTQRAMDRGSSFGRASAEEAWKAKEADALHALHAAGVRVPKPVIFYEGVLVMELVLDPAGHPAPRLIDAAIAPDQAAALYADLRAQAVRMLTCDLVHGDLSPYNVLLAWNGPTVIDFPQVVGAAHNSQAERFFVRDLESLRRFFAALDPALQSASGDAREIWRAYERRELGPDFVPSGRPPPPEKERPPRREPAGPHQAPHQGQHAPQRGAERRDEPRRGPPHGAGEGRPHGQRERRRPEERPRQGGAPRPEGSPRQGERPPQAERPRQDGPPRHGDRPRQGDRPRAGPPQRTVVVERLGPRAPTTPHAPAGPHAPRHPAPHAPPPPKPLAHAKASHLPTTPAHGAPRGGEAGAAEPGEHRKRRRRRRGR